LFVKKKKKKKKKITIKPGQRSKNFRRVMRNIESYIHVAFFQLQHRFFQLLQRYSTVNSSDFALQDGAIKLQTLPHLQRLMEETTPFTTPNILISINLIATIRKPFLSYFVQSYKKNEMRITKSNYR
jgi:hypothetical protein